VDRRRMSSAAAEPAVAGLGARKVGKSEGGPARSKDFAFPAAFWHPVPRRARCGGGPPVAVRRATGRLEFWTSDEADSHKVVFWGSSYNFPIIGLRMALSRAPTGAGGAVRPHVAAVQRRGRLGTRRLEVLLDSVEQRLEALELLRTAPELQRWRAVPGRSWVQRLAERAVRPPRGPAVASEGGPAVRRLRVCT
jgi:hypothetical protein